VLQGLPTELQDVIDTLDTELEASLSFPSSLDEHDRW